MFLIRAMLHVGEEEKFCERGSEKRAVRRETNLLSMH